MSNIKHNTMKRILFLFSAFFLFALGGNAQEPSKSAFEILDGRNYKILIEREVINQWEQPSESFAIGLTSGKTELVDKVKVGNNAREVIVSDLWIVVDKDKMTTHIGDILNYQLAGDGDVNKKDGYTASNKPEMHEFEITEYREVAKKNKRNLDLTACHNYGVYYTFKISATSKGLINVRVYNKDGDQVREYKGVLDMNYGQ